MNSDLESTHKRYKKFTESEEMRDLYEARVKYKRDVAPLINSGREEGKILDKQEILIKQLTRKFGLSEEFKQIILSERNGDILDNALDEFFFASTLEKVMCVFQK